MASHYHITEKGKVTPCRPWRVMSSHPKLLTGVMLMLSVTKGAVDDGVCLVGFVHGVIKCFAKNGGAYYHVSRMCAPM